MHTNLHQLVYISNATRVVRTDDLNLILASARRFNPSVGVTGLLLYHEGAFLQVLEGEAEALARVMKRISGDARHNGLITLLTQVVEARMFPQWSMGFQELDQLHGEQQAAFINLRDLRSGGRDGLHLGYGHVEAQVATFLDSFREFQLA